MMEKELDRILHQALDDGCAGNSLEVWRDGECVYRNAKGFADIERGIRMTPGTVYRAYSTTKPVIATAVLMLIEKGKLSLDTPLSEILPEFRDMKVCLTDARGDTEIVPAESPVLIRQLLSQTSGFTGAGYADISVCGMYHKRELDKVKEETGNNFTLKQYVDTMARSPLAFQPGTHFHYGSNFEALARVLEVLSGKSAYECLKEMIFDPLGMEKTGFRMDKDAFYKESAKFYEYAGGRFVLNTTRDHVYMPDSKYESGGGGLLTTLSDYSRFAQALACGTYRGVRLLRDGTIRMMQKNRLKGEALKDFEQRYRRHGNDFTGYGYGFGVRTLIDPERARSSSNAGEFGWYGMAGPFLLIDPKEKLSIVYNHQTIPFNAKKIHFGIRDAVYARL